MKIALCTTTIHVPHALKLLRKCSPDVRFFVAGDNKTPKEAYDFVSGIPNAEHYYHGDGAHWKCSKAIGFNTLARRNIAFLEALKWGADIVISWDTDNYPIATDYFDRFDGIMTVEEGFAFDGISVTGKDHWFDPGAYLRPPAKHRGFPIQRQHQPVYRPVTDVKVGVATGLIINDPDIDAVTRITDAPEPQQVSLLAEAGMVVDLNTWTVFNTQNTAVIRDLVPPWFLMPNTGRHDDIYASLIIQRVGRERGYHVHAGQPVALQQRHEHNLVTDLRAEIDGMENVVRLAELLDSILLVGNNTIDDTRKIYQTLLNCEFLPRKSVEAGLVWLEDCEAVL